MGVIYKLSPFFTVYLNKDVMQEEGEYYYLAIDGDNVGTTLELYILSNQKKKLQDFSEEYKNSMFWLESVLVEKLKGKIIFSGGDSILVQFLLKNFDLEYIQNLCFEFKTNF